MKIDKDHLYYGAAVLQVAEDDRYTSINQFRGADGKRVRCAYVVNNDIGLYLTYRTKKARAASWDDKKADEYLFGLDASEIAKIDALVQRYPSTYIGFVCVANERICCISAEELSGLIELRNENVGGAEDSYVICVAIFPNTRMSMKVFVTPKGRRNTFLGTPLVVAERAFPAKLFNAAN